MATPRSSKYIVPIPPGYVGRIAPPVAGFTGVPTSGTIPFSTTFTDTSTGGVTGWSWQFGDGGTSTSQNPTHAYTVAGTYSVTLTVTGPSGTSNYTRTNYVTASPVYASAFTLTGPTTGTTGSASTFTVTPTGGQLSGAATVNITASGATLSTASLSFSGGATAGQTFTVTRASNGNNNVSITNTLGLSNTGSPISYTSSSSSATTLTLTGPTTGTTGVASTFTVTPNGVMGSTVVVTPAGSGATFSPTSVTLTSGSSSAQTFTATRATDGNTSISITNNSGGSIANAGTPISYTSSTAAVSAPGGFTLTSSQTSATVPFTAGMAFQSGAIPSGQGIVVTGATAQATIKNTWPNGSAKFAIIAGTANLTSGVASAISLAAGTASTGTALTTTDLIATGITAEIGTSGTFGLASFGATEWAAPFESWISGHRMSSWIYRKQIGTDDHLVAWLEVRLFSTGAVEVLPWVENGYLLVSGPTQKTATYTFTIGGSTRFSQNIDLLHHQRTVLIGSSSAQSGAELSYWLGTDPGVTAIHDTDYMQATGLVPAYHSKTPASAAAVTSQPTTFTPLMKGSFTDGDAMTGGGYHTHVGVIPEWDAAYLTAPSVTTAQGLVRNGYTFGRYPIHYREDPTFATVADRFKVARLSNHPTLSIMEPLGGYEPYTPATSGVQPPGWFSSHTPSACFLAYLATGRRYFLDEVQFATSADSMIERNAYRDGSSGIYKSQNTGAERHVGWALRSLAQALAITPDADTAFKTEYLTQYTNNVNYYHQRYVGAGGPSNPIFNNGGFIEPYATASVGQGRPANTFWVTIWMQEFVTTAIGYAMDLGLGLDATTTTRLREFFTWKANATIKRFGGTTATEFLYRDFGPYYIPIAPSDTPDWTTGTGPWYHNTGNGWGDIYSMTFSGSNPIDGSFVPYSSPGAKVEGDIRGWYFQNSGPIAAFAALMYATKHGISGADAAYSRLISAGNFYSIRNDHDIYPLWGLAPQAYPKWWRQLNGSVTTPKWGEIAGSNMVGFTNAHTARKTNGGVAGGAPWWDPYCGLGMDRSKGVVWGVANGGHGDYYGNEVLRLDALADEPAWDEWFNGSQGNVINDPPIDDSAYYNDDGISGRLPPSAHTYYCQWPISRHNMMLRIGGGAISPTGTGWVNTEAITTTLPQGSNPWQPQLMYRAAMMTGGGTYQGGGNAAGQGVCQDPRTEKIYSMTNSNYNVLTPATTQPNGSANSGGTWAAMGAGGPTNNWGNSGPASAVDTRRGRILAFHCTDPNYWVYDIDGGTNWINGTSPAGTFTGSGVATLLAQGQGSSHGLVYDPVLDAFLVFMGGAGGQVFKIDASATVTALTIVPFTTSDGGLIPFTSMRGGGLTNVEADANYAGVYNRAQYIPRLRGVLYFPRTSANAWFLRTH